MPSRGLDRGSTASAAPDGHDPTLIRAVVHARLLGLRLLTLDARVVLAQPEVRGGDTALPLAIDPDVAPFSPPRAVAAPPVVVVRSTAGAAATTRGGVTRARELLAQGAETLAQARRRPG